MGVEGLGVLDDLPLHFMLGAVVVSTSLLRKDHVFGIIHRIVAHEVRGSHVTACFYSSGIEHPWIQNYVLEHGYIRRYTLY
jgi:hypothetical protein